jgi:mRNA interferase MazF
MQRGEVWFAATPGGDRPVLVLMRHPVVGLRQDHTLPRTAFRRPVVQLSAARMADACRVLNDAMGC